MGVPGPWLAKFTGWWLWIYEIMERREEFIEGLHRRYGSVVQIAPRMISVNNIKGLQEVYSMTRKLERPPLPIFHTYKSTNLVSTTDASLHHERRKPMRRLYAKRSIDSAEIQGLIQESSKQLLAYCARESQSSGSVGMKAALRYMSCDTMSAIVYGKDHALDLLNKEQQQASMELDFKWQDGMFDTVPGFIKALFPDFVLSLQAWNLAPASLDGSLPPGLHMDTVGKSALNSTLKASIDGDKQDLSTLMETLVETYSHELTLEIQNYMLSECLDHFWAGIVTTVDALSALTFQLSLPSNWERQQRLRTELLGRDTENDLTDLKFLNCVIRETLRLHPAFDGSLDRLSDSNLIIDGIAIPPNMEIGGQAYSLHRNVDIFPSPETWEPERWEIDSGSEQYRSMNRQFFSFGQGPRMCIGMNIAYGVMRHTVAALYGTYQTTLSSEFLPDALDAEGAYKEKLESWMDDERRPIQLETL